MSEEGNERTSVTLPQLAIGWVTERTYHKGEETDSIRHVGTRNSKMHEGPLLQYGHWDPIGSLPVEEAFKAYLCTFSPEHQLKSGAYTFEEFFEELSSLRKLIVEQTGADDIGIYVRGGVSTVEG